MRDVTRLHSVSLDPTSKRVKCLNVCKFLWTENGGIRRERTQFVCTQRIIVAHQGSCEITQRSVTQEDAPWNWVMRSSQTNLSLPRSRNTMNQWCVGDSALSPHERRGLSDSSKEGTRLVSRDIRDHGSTPEYPGTCSQSPFIYKPDNKWRITYKTVW